MFKALSFAQTMIWRWTEPSAAITADFPRLRARLMALFCDCLLVLVGLSILLLPATRSSLVGEFFRIGVPVLGSVVSRTRWAPVGAHVFLLLSSLSFVLAASAVDYQADPFKVSW